MLGSQFSSLKPSRTLVLLDRDGVINVDRPDYVKSVDEWIPIPGSIQAIRDISINYNLAVCTNQSAVGRGITSKKEVDAIHAKMAKTINLPRVDSMAVYVCEHQPLDNCSCRKPEIGLLEAAIRDFGTTPSTTYFVGDSLSDVNAAAKACCVPVLVRTGNGRATEQVARDLSKLLVFDDLREFSDFLLQL